MLEGLTLKVRCEQGVCKISDFGSSKRLGVGDGELQSPGVENKDFAETFTGTTRCCHAQRLQRPFPPARSLGA
jgi:hypothetical protein